MPESISHIRICAYIRRGHGRRRSKSYFQRTFQMQTDNVNMPQELKHMSEAELKLLCGELRTKIIDTVSKNGGHLSSNLGAVELSVSLHCCFDSPADRIIWDVGHQSYVHKLLTGRADRFDTLRRFGGISGFTLPSESPHDAFVSGHSGNSVAAALGYAETNARSGSEAFSVAVVGDGSFTNGEIYESLNNCVNRSLRLIIVLNDNEMSISRNVGAVSSYFSRFRSGKRYLRFKRRTSRILLSVPLVGKPLFKFLRGTKNLFKRILVSENLFELLGFDYIGPVDGHDISKLNAVFREAKSLCRPCVIHVLTKKGKGYPPAERRPDEYHSVSGFDKSGAIASSGGKTYSRLFGEIVCEHAEADERVSAVTAAMCGGTGLDAFKARFPSRFYDVGIAEEHAMTFTAALAAAGGRPVFAVYSSFCQRCFDQIIHDAALPALPVVLAIDRAGLVPEDGPTHHGVFDVSFLRSVPGMTVYSPETEGEMRVSFEKAFASASPSAVRYPKGTCPADSGVYTELCGGDIKYTDIGTPEKAVITYGRLCAQALEAARLAGNTRVIKLLKINPIDASALGRLLEGIKALFLPEEGIRNGGVAEWIASEFGAGRKTEIRAIERFVPHGDDWSLLGLLGLLPEQMADALRSLTP